MNLYHDAVYATLALGAGLLAFLWLPWKSPR